MKSEMIPDIKKFLTVAIFKMATTIPHKFNIVRFQCPELIPDIAYEMALKLDNVEFVRYCGGHFENGDR
jgi:putative effector of murein hydrolase